jgi:GntR family transcriptional regulator/MocR family aminotransferase
VVEAMEDGGAFPGTLEQLTLAHLIASGGFDRHVRRVRLEYHRRRDRLVAHLGDRVRVSGIAAGVHALVHLPAGATEAEVSARAAEHDLAVRGLSHYTAPGHPHPQALVIGYATPPAHAYAASLDRLRAVLAG